MKLVLVSFTLIYSDTCALVLSLMFARGTVINSTSALISLRYRCGFCKIIFRMKNFTAVVSFFSFLSVG